VPLPPLISPIHLSVYLSVCLSFTMAQIMDFGSSQLVSQSSNLGSATQDQCDLG
jgi:hypothetical protein